GFSRDWSSDVCSSDLVRLLPKVHAHHLSSVRPVACGVVLHAQLAQPPGETVSHTDHVHLDALQPPLVDAVNELPNCCHGIVAAKHLHAPHPGAAPLHDHRTVTARTDVDPALHRLTLRQVQEAAR